MNEFASPDSWRTAGAAKGELTIKGIIMQQIQHTVSTLSREMHGGFNALKGSKEVVEYVPDSRQVFVNSVRALRALLLMYFEADDELRTKKMALAAKVTIKEFDAKFKTNLDTLNKELHAKYPGKDESSITKFNTEWDVTLVDQYILLFEQLLLLSHRMKFFAKGVHEPKPA